MTGVDLSIKGLFLGAAFLVVGLPAFSASIQIDPALYGHVDQNSITTCNSEGAGMNSACGPTAALNSFIFLQNRYPWMYNGSNLLIPHTDGNTPEQDQIAAGQTLGCYMGCGDNGTTISNFILGKQLYLDSVAPGTTVISSMNKFAPGGAYPTFNWLLSELQDGEDIELLVGFYKLNAETNLLERTGGHYVTLNGINSDTNDGSGTITFVDPSGGTDVTADTFFNVGDGSIRSTDYLSAGTTVTIIEAAVSESPIPEPASMALLGTSLLVIGLVRRRKRS